MISFIFFFFIRVRGACKDVIAAFGEFFSETTMYSAQVYGQYKIPLCGGTQYITRLLDKTMYPYFIETVGISGYCDSIASLLTAWNVRRVVLISRGNINNPDTTSACFLRAFVKQGLHVTARLSFISKKNI
ncbi:hypothetical protein BDR26DRAFT_851320, partial [Obelidium mucronatum]